MLALFMVCSCGSPKSLCVVCCLFNLWEHNKKKWSSPRPIQPRPGHILKQHRRRAAPFAALLANFLFCLCVVWSQHCLLHPCELCVCVPLRIWTIIVNERKSHASIAEKCIRNERTKWNKNKRMQYYTVRSMVHTRLFGLALWFNRGK